MGIYKLLLLLSVRGDNPLLFQNLRFSYGFLKAFQGKVAFYSMDQSLDKLNDVTYFVLRSHC